MTTKKTFPIFFLVTLLLSGCAQQNFKYHWGNYEDLLLEEFTNEGEISVAGRIDKLNVDIQEAQAEGKPLPPGFYAHLGMLYASENLSEKAIEALLLEKELYPESKVLVDRLLENYTQGATNNET